MKSAMNTKKMALAIFVKNYERVPCKTRLAQGSDKVFAQKFYQLSLDCIKEQFPLLKKHFDIWLSPADKADETWVKKYFPRTKIIAQTDSSNLGKRIEAINNELHEYGYEHVGIIGSDSPSLPMRYLLTLRDALKSNDVSLGPCDDGGFYFIGTSKKIYLSEKIRWSHNETLNDTIDHLKMIDQRIFLGNSWYDIDTIADTFKLAPDLSMESICQKKLLMHIASQAKVSIVIPIKNEEKLIKKAHTRLQALKPQPEIIFVDGNSSDQSKKKICQSGAHYLYSSQANRGHQFNEGQKKASGKIIIFLHIDSILLQKTYTAMIRSLYTQECQGGCFRFALEANNDKFFTKVTEIGVKLRNQLFNLPYGDQGFFILNDFFEPYMTDKLLEDVEWYSRLSKKLNFKILKEPLYTSPRRMRARGWIQSWIKNISIITLYQSGFPVKYLAKLYYKEKTI